MKTIYVFPSPPVHSSNPCFPPSPSPCHFTFPFPSLLRFLPLSSPSHFSLHTFIPFLPPSPFLPSLLYSHLNLLSFPSYACPALAFPFHRFLPLPLILSPVVSPSRKFKICDMWLSLQQKAAFMQRYEIIHVLYTCLRDKNVTHCTLAVELSR